MPTATKPIPSKSIAWVEWLEIPRFSLRYRHLTLAALGENYRVGVAVEELPAGKQSAPAQYHIFEEEHVYVLEGTLGVRLGTQSFAMRPGDYVCFPAGRRLEHCLINNSDATCRYVIIGERNPNEVVVYADSRKVLVRALGRRAIFDLEATKGYWDGEDTGLSERVAPPIDEVRISPAPSPDVFPPIAAENVPWEETQVGTLFGGRARHLTYAAVGAGYHVGVLIEAPAPGKRLAPRHYHMLEEEHALILDGEVALLMGDDRYEMTAGDYVCFPAGQKIGHSFMNSGTGPCSYLMIGERRAGDVCVYPDSNKMAVPILSADNDIFDMSAVRKYWEGEKIG